jgi:hypothetical protein
MSECFGGDTCTYGSYEEPWEPWGGAGGYDPEPDPWDDDDGGGGGGGGGNSDPTPDPDPVVIDPHTVQDGLATLAQVVTALKQVLAIGLNTVQAAKITSMISKINDAITAINAIDQITDHTVLSDIIKEGLGIAASLLVGYVFTVAGAPIVIGVLAGAAVGAITEEYLLDSLENLYYEFEAIEPPNWDDEIFCRIAKFCDYQIPPIVLDLDGDGIELLSKKESSARLDIDNDGFYERISWVKGDDALLYIDHNNNGIIDENNEFSFARFAGPGAGDLEGLRTFDLNQDNVLDSKDEIFSKAGIWQDINENAVQEPGEMKSLTEAKISSISLLGDNAMQAINDSVIANNMTYTVKEDNGEQVTKVAGDVLFYGNLLSGIKKHMLDDVNYVIEVEKNDKIILDLSHDNIDKNVTVGSDDYAGFKSFSRVITGSGDDVITVNTAENIQIKTGSGNDTVHGGDGNDQIRGNKGKDNLFGGNGDDYIIGGKGNDTIVGGFGNDTLKGGKGKDTFVVGQDHDTVLDFDAGKDTIRIDGLDGLNINDLISELEITSQGVKLNFSDNDSLHLIGISAEELYVDDFVLVE